MSRFFIWAALSFGVYLGNAFGLFGSNAATAAVYFSGLTLLAQWLFGKEGT